MKLQIPTAKCTPVHFERLIRERNGRFIGVWSKTKKGLRFFHCRTGVHFGKHLKANPNDAYGLPYICVWDLKMKKYRTINLSEIRTVCCDGKHYRSTEFSDKEIEDVLSFQYDTPFYFRFFNKITSIKK